jgi:hypothetical protein
MDGVFVLGKTLPMVWKICVIQSYHKNKTLAISALSYIYFGTDFAVISRWLGDWRCYEFIYDILKT